MNDVGQMAKARDFVSRWEILVCISSVGISYFLIGLLSSSSSFFCVKFLCVLLVNVVNDFNVVKILPQVNKESN